MFSIVPRAENIIEVCQSPPCHFSGAPELLNWFEAAAGIKCGESTADGKITLQRCNCVGACDTGPVAKIGDQVFGDLNEEKTKDLVNCCRDGLSAGNKIFDTEGKSCASIK